MVKPEFKDKSIRSFVIRGGRMTEAQQAAFDQWWPVYGCSLFDGDKALGDFLKPEQPLVVEVGFGMGDSLLEMAIASPEVQFVGIEVHPPGVGRLINEAGKAQLTNLKVFMADANDVLADCFAEGSIDRFQLYFPDPWHKKKHHKRRIVQPEFVQLIASRLKAGGHLHMATDWENYAEYMSEVMQEQQNYANTASDGLYVERPEFRPVTKFEKRGARLGHGVWDLLYKRV